MYLDSHSIGLICKNMLTLIYKIPYSTHRGVGRGGVGGQTLIKKSQSVNI